MQYPPPPGGEGSSHAPMGKMSTLLPKKRVVGADTMSYVHSLFSACAAAIGGWCDTCSIPQSGVRGWVAVGRWCGTCSIPSTGAAWLLCNGRVVRHLQHPLNGAAWLLCTSHSVIELLLSPVLDLLMNLPDSVVTAFLCAF